MSPEQQRISIAEACGWTVAEHDLNGNCYLCPPNKGMRVHAISVRYDHHIANFVEWLPDYLNDLNACHEMEKMLNPSIDPEPNSPWDKLLVALSKITKGGSNVHATAAQRAEAFLKALGLWIT